MKPLDFNTLDRIFSEEKLEKTIHSSIEALQDLKKILPTPEMPPHVSLPTLQNRNDNLWLLVLDGVQHGPYTSDQLLAMISSGEIDTNAFVWKSGMEQWMPIKDCPGIIK